jgi:hypothetical protein
MFGQVPHPVQAGVADPGLVGAALDVGQVARRAPGPENLIEFGAVPHAVAVVRVPRVLSEIGTAEQIPRQPPPLAVARGAEDGRLPVGGRVGAVGRDHRRSHPDRLELLPRVQHLVEREPHHLRHHVQHRDWYDRAPAGPFPFVQGGEHAGVGVQGCADVGDRYAGLGRLPRAPGDRAGSALGLHEQVIGALVVERTAPAVAGDVDHDQPRVARGEHLGREPETAERTGSEVADQDIGALEQGGEHVEVRRLGQVEGRGLLAVVQPHEMGGHAPDHAVVVPGRVAGSRLLDLDHPGAEVGQVPSAQRRSDGLLESQDGNAGQRRRAGGMGAGRRGRQVAVGFGGHAAMIPRAGPGPECRRWVSLDPATTGRPAARPGSGPGWRAA